MSDLVSIIIPTYNRAESVCRAVRSVLAQEHESTQVIVVDDGSTDATQERLQEFGDRIHVYRQENAGASVARNVGLREASGEFVSFLDSDDELEPGFLGTLISALKEYPDCALAFANWRGRKGDGEIVYEDWFAQKEYCVSSGTLVDGGWRHLKPAAARGLFAAHSAAPTSSVVLRRAAIRTEWDPTLTIGEDNLFFLSCLVLAGMGCLMTSRVLWTKHMDVSNLYFGNEDHAYLAREHIRSEKAKLEKLGKLLSSADRESIRQQISTDFKDWAWAEKERGRYFQALWRYLQHIRWG